LKDGEVTMKQSTLFPHDEIPIIAELDLKEAEKIANQVKTSVGIHCDKIEIAGSLRRQKTKVHDIDFVVVTKSDGEWQKVNYSPLTGRASTIRLC
jgi:DNA polymerase/3'-5' exonuclease PolX